MLRKRVIHILFSSLLVQQTKENFRYCTKNSFDTFLHAILLCNNGWHWRMSIVGRVIFSARVHSSAFLEIRLFSINMEAVNVINKLLQNVYTDCVSVSWSSSISGRRCVPFAVFSGLAIMVYKNVYMLVQGKSTRKDQLSVRYCGAQFVGLLL